MPVWQREIYFIVLWFSDYLHLSSSCNPTSLSKQLLWKTDHKHRVKPFEFACDRTLKGQDVNVSAFATFPYSSYFDADKQFRGSDIEVMQTLAKKFEYTIHIYRTRPWVKDSKSGKWFGMVGDVSF